MTRFALRDVWTDLERRASQPFLAGAASMRRSDLSALVRRFCAAFDASGVGAGERLMIVLEHEPAAIAAFVAALLDGIVPVMLAPETPPARAAAVAASVGAAGAVVGRERLGEAWLPQSRAPIAFDAAAARKASWFARPNAAHRIADACGLPEHGRPPRLPPDPDGLAYILFTSGTTSSPTA